MIPAASSSRPSPDGPLNMGFFDRRPAGGLDHALAHWSDSDPWTVETCLPNTLIVEEAGPGRAPARATIPARRRAPRNSGGAIFAAKPERGQGVRPARLPRGTRAGPRIFISWSRAATPSSYNVLDYERSRRAACTTLTQACMTFKETLTRTEGGGGGGGDDNAAYFAGQERIMLHNTIQVLLLATGRIDPWAMQVPN